MALRASRRRIGAAAVALVLLAALAYLRDPPWLIRITSGLGAWERSSDGTAYRWMGGHASFFVPADRGAIELPLRAVFERPGDWPIVAVISIDDVPAAHMTFSDDRWQHARLELPARSDRRVRRINIRVDRTRSGQRGLQVGAIR